MNEENKSEQKTKTLKLDQKKSRFAKQLEDKQSFEQKADAAHSKVTTRQEEIFLLGSKFIKIIEDKTLPDNKGPIQKSLENEILGKLINFAIELNNDLDEPNADMGSVSLLTLMLKTVISLRDKYNLIEYKAEQLEKQLKQIEVERSTSPSHDR